MRDMCGDGGGRSCGIEGLEVRQRQGDVSKVMASEQNAYVDAWAPFKFGSLARVWLKGRTSGDNLIARIRDMAVQLNGAGELWATWPSSAAHKKQMDGMTDALMQAATEKSCEEQPELRRNAGKLHMGATPSRSGTMWPM